VAAEGVTSAVTEERVQPLLFRRTRCGKQADCRAAPNEQGRRPMLWLLALIILLLALGGGIFLSKFIFLLIIIAVLVALFSRRTV
jgi:hypothetical protein